MNEPDHLRLAVSRRRLIEGALAAGLVWSAPSVRSVRLVSTSGTPPPETTTPTTFTPLTCSSISFEGQSHGVSFPNRHLLGGDTIVVHTDFPVSGSPTPSLIRAAAFAQSGSSIPIYEATGPFPGTFSLVILTPDEYLIQVEVLGSGAEVIFTISCTEGT
jgi:hypothetical protein